MTFNVSNFVGGAWVETGRSFVKHSPVDGRLVATVHEADQALVDRAVEAGQAAVRDSWGVMPVQKRAEILRRMSALVGDYADEIVEADCAETGRPRGISRSLNTDRAAYLLRTAAEEATAWYGDSYFFETPDGGKVLNYTTRHPRGVVAVFGPWNMPLLLLLMNVAPALAAGNAVIAKPSEETPVTASILARIAAEAGLPDGVLSVLQGGGAESTGEFLTDHPDIAAYALIGECRTGELIMKRAASGLRPVNFELGGKNPAVICGDADMAKAVPGSIASAFANCGQVCFNTERIFVHSSRRDEFLDLFLKAISKIRIGRPEDADVSQGPLISRNHREKVIAAVERAKSDGAECLTGGDIPRFGNELDKGAFYSPTVLTGLGDDSDIMSNEVFGPVCHVSTFDETDEVIARANATPYGLASAIWTENISTGHLMASRIRAGVNWINCWQTRDPRTPLAGFGRSGVGMGGSRAALEFFSQQGIVTLKH